MPNIATLGLEFESKKTLTQITALCDKFDKLAEKGESIQKIFAELKPLDNTFVTQVAALGSAFKSLNALKPDTAQAISGVTRAMAAAVPISSNVTTSLTTLANGLKGVKLDADTSRSFSDLSLLMGNLRPVDPAVTASLQNLIGDINNLQPINTGVAASIRELFNSVTVVAGLGNVQNDLENIANSIKKFGAIKPEIAVSVRELLASFSLLKSLDANSVRSIAEFGDATRKFTAIKPQVAVSVRDLFSALERLPEINAAKSTAVRNLAEATAKFKAIKPPVVQSIQQLFATIAQIKNIPYNTTDSVNKLGDGLAKFKKIDPNLAQRIRDVFNALNSVGAISANTRMSIDYLVKLLNSMAAASTRASGAVRTLGGSMGQTSTQADGLSIAFRSLQGALSINFFKHATQQAIEFGRELAHIKSIAPELSAQKIGKGIMGFSSLLGDPSQNLEALYYAYSSGIRGTEDDFLDFTEIVQKTAQVNRASVVPMADAMTAAMNAYNISVSRAGEVADNFYAIVKYGKASGEQLANSFGQVSPTAKTLGVSLDELGAAIASLTKIQPTRVAITGLNNMLSKIMKPTKESRLALQRLGVDMSYSAVQSKGFVTVLNEVRQALNGNMEELKNIFPDIRGQRAAMQLLGAGWKDFNEQLTNFANKKGSMEEAFRVYSMDNAVQFGALPETFKKIVTEAGKMVIEFVTLGGILTPLIASFNNMSEGTRKFFGAVTLLVGGFAAYKSIMFAIQSLHAIQIKNEATLALAQTNKLAQLRAEILLRKKLAGLSTVNMFDASHTIAGVGKSRAGFGAGFYSMFKPIKMANMSLKRFSAIIKINFAKAVTYAGAVLGKLATVITTVFSAANMIISGGAAIAAVGLDYAINGVEKSLTTDILEKIYIWWTNAAEKAKVLDEHIKRVFANASTLRAANTFMEDYLNNLKSLRDSLTPKDDQQRGKANNAAFTNSIENMHKIITDYDALTSASAKLNSKVKEYGDEVVKLKNNMPNWTNAIAQAFRGNEYFTAKSKLAEAEEKLKKAQEKALQVQKEISQNEEKATNALNALRGHYNTQLKLIRERLAALTTMEDAFDEQSSKELGTDYVMRRNESKFNELSFAFFDAMNKGAVVAAKDALVKARGYYNTLRDNAVRISEKMVEIQAEAALMGLNGDGEKMQYYAREAQKFQKKAQDALKMTEYNAAAEALRNYIINAKNAAAIQDRLADAEQRANQKTLQLIQSMDKFKSSAQAAIDANSTDALKLRYRQFQPLPTYTPVTNQQSASQQANQALTQNIKQLAEGIKNSANATQTRIADSWQKMENRTSQDIQQLRDDLVRTETETNHKLTQIITKLSTVLSVKLAPGGTKKANGS